EQPDVAKQLEEIREKAITQTYLEAQAEPPESYPSDAEIEAAYEENKAGLKTPPQVRLAQIFVALPSDAGAEAAANAKVKLDQIQTELSASGAEFASIAKANSEEPQSAAQGGEIGWLTEEQIQPGIREEMGQLDAGKVSKPIRLADGYHIVKVLETKPESTPALEDIRDALADRLRAAKAQENSQTYVAELLQQSPIAINEMMLTELLPEN
ncbi:MAG: peptidylprolyl isomerase, partial [Chthoniobacterales bacterium]